MLDESVAVGLARPAVLVTSPAFVLKGALVLANVGVTTACVPLGTSSVVVTTLPSASIVVSTSGARVVADERLSVVVSPVAVPG